MCLLYIQGKLGVLQLSLCYQPSSETITIVIMKARDLKAKDINGLSGNIILMKKHAYTITKLHITFHSPLSERNTGLKDALFCQDWLVLGWVTVCGRVNRLGM